MKVNNYFISGQIMKKYEIIDLIDEGAYGIVWKAINKQNNMLVAIKEFKQNDDDDLTKKAIQRQIKMLKLLKGEYVVEIIEAFKKKGKIFLIFEYFQKNILNLIERYEKGLDPKLIQRIIYMCVKCLRFLHSKNILHRDIKPENILIDNTYSQLKLCDFGFARFYSDHDPMTDYVATRWYRSPQLLVGQLYGKPADMWALGCILGELVDGQPMFPGENQIDQLFLIKKTIGHLTASQISQLSTNQKFLGMNFPPIRNIQSIEARYLGKIQKNALDFMKMCLKVNPQQRLSAEDAMSHCYIVELSLIERELSNDQQNLLQLKDRKKHSLEPKDLKNNSSGLMYKNSSIQTQIYGKVFDSKNLLRIGGLSSLPEQQMLKFKNNVIKHDYLQKKKFPIKRSEDNINNDMILTRKKFSNNISPKLKFKKDASKRFAKMISEEKKASLNLDVNLKIDFKINPSMKALHITQLPEIKQNNTKGLKYLVNIRNPSKKILDSNLSILGESKQLTKANKKTEK